MIEELVRNYLMEKLTVPVEFHKQTGQSEYVLLQKTGSGRENFLNHATFAIQSYSETLYGAMVLNDVVKLALLGDGTESFGIAGEVSSVSKCSLNSDYEYSDTAKKEHRYQAVFDFVYIE